MHTPSGPAGCIYSDSRESVWDCERHHDCMIPFDYIGVFLFCFVAAMLLTHFVHVPCLHMLNRWLARRKV